MAVLPMQHHLNYSAGYCLICKKLGRLQLLVTVAFGQEVIFPVKKMQEFYGAAVSVIS
jgi:hypothetical protein